MATRYTLYTGDGCLTEDSGGEYVEYEDYAKLEDELKTERADNSELRAVETAQLVEIKKLRARL